MLPHINKDMLNEFKPKLKLYKKKTLTRAIRMKGAFEVVTKEGWLTCQDGYLAFDNQDWPYPIAKDEFEKIYEVV